MMTFNQDALLNSSGTNSAKIKVVDNLGSYISNSNDNIKICKALARSACHKMHAVWRSTLTREQRAQEYTLSTLSNS